MEEKMSKNISIVFFNFIPLLIIFFAVSAFSEEVREIPKNLNLSHPKEYFNSYYFQTHITSDKSLGTLVKENSSVGEEATSFGFAAKSADAKFFIIGTLYSESLAYLQSGNLDLAAKRLESIEKEFINLGVPNSLYNYISKTRNLIETKRCSTEVLGEFLSLFQPFFEDYSKSKGENKLTLFRAGSWLMDMSLTAAAGDKQLIRQDQKLKYFIEKMKKMDAPKGVLTALDQIVKITEQKEISEKDTEEVLKLVKKIQTILA